MKELNNEYDWCISDYIIDENNKDDLIIRISVEPLNRNSYYFYIFENMNNIYVKCSYVTDEENLRYIIKSAKKAGIKGSKDILDTFKKVFATDEYKKIFSACCNIYDMNLDNDYLRFAINEIRQLDYDTPLNECLGLDGYSLYFNLINENKNFYTWCSSHNKYYYRIIELVNYLLKCVSVYEIDDCFYVDYDSNQVYKNMKVIDNNIHLDRERLLQQFDLKFENKKELEEDYIKYRGIVESLSVKKIHKINYNLRISMLNDNDRTKRIIDYVTNQSEENVNPFDWCGYEEDYKKIYGNRD